jgi:CRP-like cAMP-binding protein
LAGQRSSAQHSPRAAWLAATPLFKGLALGTLEEIAAAARERRVGAKQPLFREGEAARELVLLAAGRMKIVQLTASGNAVIQRIAVPGELVSGPDIVPGALHAAAAVALEPCDVLAWDVRAFEPLAERHPLLQRNALRIVAQRVRDIEQRYRELATEKVAVRLARTLLRLLGQLGRARGEAVVIALSRAELGQMIGATLFSVSRLLSHWETQGLVVAAREAIVVKDAAALVRLAEADDAEASARARRAPFAPRR